MLLVRVIRFLIIIVIAAGSNCDPLGAPLLSLFAAFGASLRAFADDFEWCPLAAARDYFTIALNEDGPNSFFTRSVLGGDVK
jgi:hypothetical protein